MPQGQRWARGGRRPRGPQGGFPERAPAHEVCLQLHLHRQVPLQTPLLSAHVLVRAVPEIRQHLLPHHRSSSGQSRGGIGPTLLGARGHAFGEVASVTREMLKYLN